MLRLLVAGRLLLLAITATPSVTPATAYDPESLEFFSHIPGAGGSAWSWHLRAAFDPREVASGSAERQAYGRGERGRRGAPLDPLLVAPDTPYRVMFAHGLPNLPVRARRGGESWDEERE